MPLVQTNCRLDDRIANALGDLSAAHGSKSNIIAAGLLHVIKSTQDERVRLLRALRAFVDDPQNKLTTFQEEEPTAQ